MKILFVARHHTYFRNFESVIRLLASRGHHVHLAAERDETLGGSMLVEQLAAECPGVTVGEAPGRENDEWSRLATRLRLAFDYLRYLEPAFDGTPRLRSRAAERAPEFAVRFGASRWCRVWLARRALGLVVRAAEKALPPSPRIEAFLREQQPDVMLITPLIGVVRSPQPDYMRASRTLRIPTALCVWSWDHLSSKALIRDMPDRVFVWNGVQRSEAVRLHRVPPARVVVTGAQCFDQWFGRAASRTRERFCAQVGLAADRPFILYAGSALFRGSPSEAAFVMRWIAHLRASSDPVVRNAGILVRPHPQRKSEWNGIDVSALGNVALWGDNPVTEAARADYFDSLTHSAAVVGLNTSAFLEAAIAGRPVLTILPDEFRDSQEGTIHFHYLLSAGGGLLRTSRSFDEHVAHVREALTSPAEPGAHSAFIEAFIRPNGPGLAATPVFADGVEALEAVAVTDRVPHPSWFSRACLRAFTRIAASPRYRALMMDEEDRRAHAWKVERAKARAAHRRAGLDAEQRAEAERQMRAHRTS